MATYTPRTETDAVTRGPRTDEALEALLSTMEVLPAELHQALVTTLGTTPGMHPAFQAVMRALGRVAEAQYDDAWEAVCTGGP